MNDFEGDVGGERKAQMRVVVGGESQPDAEVGTPTGHVDVCAAVGCMHTVDVGLDLATFFYTACE